MIIVMVNLLNIINVYIKYLGLEFYLKNKDKVKINCIGFLLNF